jgi:hypothetical protein
MGEVFPKTNTGKSSRRFSTSPGLGSSKKSRLPITAAAASKYAMKVNDAGRRLLVQTTGIGASSRE